MVVPTPVVYAIVVCAIVVYATESVNTIFDFVNQQLMDKIKTIIWRIVLSILCPIASVIFWLIEIKESEYWEEDHRDWEY